jgi:hypothetical protein
MLREGSAEDDGMVCSDALRAPPGSSRSAAPRSGMGDFIHGIGQDARVLVSSAGWGLNQCFFRFGA